MKITNLYVLYMVCCITLDFNITNTYIQWSVNFNSGDNAVRPSMVDTVKQNNNNNFLV